jgi:hypothetical protein
MLQVTERDGRALPISFEWKEPDGSAVRVKIDRVISVTSSAERKSGAVGDCYECEISGRTEYLYYGKIQPRKWFLIQMVSETEYNEYYKLPNESKDRSVI